MFCRCFLHFFLFFLFFFRPSKMRQLFSGTAERICMKLLPNDGGGECSLKRRAAAWRMVNVDALRNLRYENCGITVGSHWRLRYTTMSGRIDVI